MVAVNSDPRLFGICFLGPIFTHNLPVHNFFAAIMGDIFVADDMESVSPLDALFLGDFRSFSYYLENSSQLVVIIFVSKYFGNWVAS